MNLIDRGLSADSRRLFVMPFILVLVMLFSSLATINIFADTGAQTGKYHALKDISTESPNIINYGNAIVKDAAPFNSAAQMYDMLKADSKTQEGVLKGIQIFGSAPSDSTPGLPGDVPFFSIGLKWHWKITRLMIWV